MLEEVLAAEPDHECGSTATLKKVVGALSKESKRLAALRSLPEEPAKCIGTVETCPATAILERIKTLVQYDTDETIIDGIERLVRSQQEEPVDTSHEFQIVGDEDALLLRCNGRADVESHVFGIYDDLAKPCPGCGERFVLRMGHARLIRLSPAPAAKEENHG